MTTPEILPLTAADAPELAALIARQAPGYLTHFHPFALDEATLLRQIGTARKDRYWGLRVEGKLAGFFMLRGFDEGYARPTFGVFVAGEAAGRGLGRLALEHSIAWCVENGVERVMLKVSPDNPRARAIYIGAGFQSVETCPRTGHDVLEKHLAKN